MMVADNKTLSSSDTDSRNTFSLQYTGLLFSLKHAVNVQTVTTFPSPFFAKLNGNNGLNHTENFAHVISVFLTSIR